MHFLLLLDLLLLVIDTVCSSPGSFIGLFSFSNDPDCSSLVSATTNKFFNAQLLLFDKFNPRIIIAIIKGNNHWWIHDILHNHSTCTHNNHEQCVASFYDLLHVATLVVSNTKQVKIGHRQLGHLYTFDRNQFIRGFFGDHILQKC